METHANLTAPPSDRPPAARPPWVMLKPGVNNKMDSDSAVADAKTRAASCTSSGQSFSVSFSLAPPPATSTYYCDWIGGALGSISDDCRRHRLYPNTDKSKILRIIAAHHNTLLIAMGLPDVRDGFRYTNTYDYFLYDTGSAARPPSMSLLPGCYISKQYDRDKGGIKVPTRCGRPRSLHNGGTGDTGVLRCGDGEGELLVAQLEVMTLYHGEKGEGPHDMAEIVVLRPGRGSDWDLKQLSIVHHEAGGKLLDWPQLDAAVPVGTRFMCWVDYVSGSFVCDMVEESSPKVRYVPLPVPPPKQHRRNDERRYMPYCRNLGAAGPNVVRFVNIAPRCCCGGPGRTECERSRFAFNVTTWTLTLRTEGPMMWVKDGVLDCDELWQLPNYGCLPRVVPQYPIVSSENPDIVCFVVDDDVDKTEWMLQINTRSKELCSVVRGDTNLYIDYRVRAKLRWQLGN